MRENYFVVFFLIRSVYILKEKGEKKLHDNYRGPNLMS
jgi:hypothetical protein